MSPNPVCVRRIVMTAVLGASLFAPLGANRALSAQTLDHLQFGIGYVADAPDQMAGGSLYAIWPILGGLGIYVDAKFDIDSPAKDIAFRSDLTGADVRSSEEFSGARFLKQEFSFTTFNVALVRPISPRIFLYGGAGLAQAENYKLYEQIIGDLGYALWVTDPDFDETRVNVLGGAILRISSSVSTQIGYETNPEGITAGVSLRLPAW